MIELKKHPVKILHINVRTEQHGDEEKTAVDLKLGFDVPNIRLDDLMPGLQEALYEQSKDLDLLGPDKSNLTHVRFPRFGSRKSGVAWTGEWESVGLHLHLGNGRGKGDLDFADSTFGRMTIAPKEGGSVTCVARAQILPTPD
ncbi:hypothetical protein ACLFKT_25965, partial [Paraburkholderia sp. BR14261]